jgi:hypothetical protein
MRAMTDLTPWMVCKKCVSQFLGTQEEKARAYDLAQRYRQKEIIPLEVLPTTSSLFEKESLNSTQQNPTNNDYTHRGGRETSAKKRWWQFWN